MLGLTETVDGEGLYDDLGELAVRIVTADGAPLPGTELANLEAILQEHGGKTPSEDEVADYRERNPRRRETT